MAAERNGAFRIVGGHPALDLVNTVAPRRPEGGGHIEYLPTPGDLLAWARRIRLVDEAEADRVAAAWAASPDAAVQALAAAVDIREAVYRVLARRIGLTSAADAAVAADGADGGGDRDGGAEVAAAGLAPALERLALRWTAAAGRSRLVPAEDGPSAVRLAVGDVPALLIPDRLAHACVDFLRTGEIGRVRACPIEEGGCGWLFLDHSRNRSRRWCAMADCGSQAKARRLTARRRTARATGEHTDTGS